MIHCIWYPSGGFGHYINAVLNSFGHNFVRPANGIEFSKDGNSHDVKYVAPKYYKNQNHYSFEFDTNLNYSVIVDNGINDESTRFMQFFPGANVIKVCYDDYTWPIIAHTMITKAMGAEKSEEIAVDQDKWSSLEAWAQREKYFLFLRDHSLRHAWRSNKMYNTLWVNDIIDYKKFVNSLSQLGVITEDFASVHNQWRRSNQSYIDPVIIAEEFVNNASDTVITDVWTQSIVYYQIWCKYGVEVPHNDFANFFQSQEQYQHWLHSVT